jgi:predicted metal-binding membrane protein
MASSPTWGTSAPDELVLQGILKRDRTLVLFGLATVGLVTWAYTIHTSMEVDNGAHHHTHSAVDFLLLFWMWAVMMAAMMLPAVTPTVLTVAAINRRNRRERFPFLGTACFLIGYLATWTVFSALAALGQVLLHNRALLSAQMATATPILGGSLLALSGLFQLSPWKQACLKHCRSPLSFLMTRWRRGVFGSLRMGIWHGAYCTGCCWALMVLMFVAGVMNIRWFLVITGLVLVEKVQRHGVFIGKVAGFVLFALGIYLLAQSLT